MGERSIDHVQIALSRETIAIPWESRQALLAKLRPIEAMREVVLAFEAVGTTRPVELTAEQKDDLHAVRAGLRRWSRLPAQSVARGTAGVPVAVLIRTTVPKLARERG